MSTILVITFKIALALHLVMAGVAVWRIWRGENVADRLTGVELLTTLMMAVLVLLALIQRDSIYIDIAIALAALGFITTLAMAKYLADEQMF
ncbi:MAG: monovalent cation/H+ antiporter complex subunit F [Chloroflexota bacterium]